MWTRIIVFLAFLVSPVWAKPTPDTLCREGDALLRQHHPKEGLAKYDEALRLDRKSPRAWAGLGAFYYEVARKKTGKSEVLEGAIKILGRAIRFNPKNDKLLFYRGDLYSNQMKFAPALKDLNRSLSLKPHTMAHMSRAVCYSATKQYQKAVIDYTEVYRMTHDAACLYGRGNNYMGLGRPDLAMADYERVVKECKVPRTVAAAGRELKSIRRLTGEKVTVRTRSEAAEQAFVEARQVKNSGHPRESLALFDKALSLDPRFAKAAIYKGDAYFMLRDLDQAIVWYRKGLQLDPTDKQGHRFLGDTLEKKFDQTENRKYLEEAIHCYEAALRTDPSYGYASVNLRAAKERLKKL